VPEGFRDAVLAVVAGLAAGEVVSYGDVAGQAGHPGASRGVGAVLAGTRTPVPWWRVVYADGRMAPGKEAEQARRLQAEGVDVRDGRVARRQAASTPPTRRARQPPA
jgi:methylated-DNA-protein-cysteine methyltransferase-like protein